MGTFLLLLSLTAELFGRESVSSDPIPVHGGLYPRPWPVPIDRLQLIFTKSSDGQGGIVWQVRKQFG